MNNPTQKPHPITELRAVDAPVNTLIRLGKTPFAKLSTLSQVLAGPCTLSLALYLCASAPNWMAARNLKLMEEGTPGLFVGFFGAALVFCSMAVSYNALLNISSKFKINK